MADPKLINTALKKLKLPGVFQVTTLLVVEWLQIKGFWIFEKKQRKNKKSIRGDDTGK